MVATVSSKLSHTRGVPLVQLSGLCWILDRCSPSVSVTELASVVAQHGIIPDLPMPRAGRLPTRFNHHLIALRELGLAEATEAGSRHLYQLTQAGQRLLRSTEASYSGRNVPALTDELRAAWRPILVASSYVRSHWLHHFMPFDEFDHMQFAEIAAPIAILRVPVEQRHDAEDSGYRIMSPHRGEQKLDLIERREIYEGLRRWTTDAYLTDDRIAPYRSVPFSYLAGEPNAFEIEVHPVRLWLDPHRDLNRFSQIVNRVLDMRGHANRITMPELIVEICNFAGLAKGNVRTLLHELYVHHGDRYFFERGSNFLIRNAFDVPNPEEYYILLDGVWRTGLVRY